MQQLHVGALLKHYVLIIFDASFIRNLITVGFLASTCEMILVEMGELQK